MVDKLIKYRNKWINYDSQDKFVTYNYILGMVGFIGYIALIILLQKDLPAIKPIRQLINYTPLYCLLLILVIVLYCLVIYQTIIHKKDSNDLDILVTDKTCNNGILYDYILTIVTTLTRNTFILLVSSIIYSTMYALILGNSNNFMNFIYIFIASIFWTYMCRTVYNVWVAVNVIIISTIPVKI